MCTVIRGLLQIRWQPCYQSVRFRKANIQRPRPPHFERARVLDTCKPQLPAKHPQDAPMYLKCSQPLFSAKKEEVHPYEDLLAKDMLNLMNHSRFIAFFHANILTLDDTFEVKLALKKNNMILRQHGKKVMEKAVHGTKYEPIMVLFQSHTYIVCSTEPNVEKLFKILKKLPKITLMGGIVDDSLLNRKELEKYTKLPDLQTMRSQLVGVLNMAPQALLQNLNHHPSTLVQHLNNHAELSQNKSTLTSSTESQQSEVKKR